jgi:hypothetical protein
MGFSWADFADVAIPPDAMASYLDASVVPTFAICAWTEAADCTAIRVAVEPGRSVVESLPSGRATCRTCKAKIAKGELRSGEVAPNAYDDESMRWHHLKCAAEKKAAIFGPVLAAYEGDVPDRDALTAIVDGKTKKAKGKPSP